MQKHLRVIMYTIILLTSSLGIYLITQKNARSSFYNPPSKEMPGHGVVGNEKTISDPYDVLITYTNEGFSPRDVTITSGQRIRFLNASNEETWPASGVHPTHSLYPEKQSTDCLGSSFDSCYPLKQGEFFDYTFYYTGEWRYHDHNHAYQTGSVTVTELP